MSQPKQQWDPLPVPQIDEDRCTGCGLCIQACPNGALSLVGRTACVTQPHRCDYTGYCERICPAQAIERPFQIIVIAQQGE